MSAIAGVRACNTGQTASHYRVLHPEAPFLGIGGSPVAPFIFGTRPGRTRVRGKILPEELRL